MKMWKINIWLWFEIIVIFKDETLNLQKIKTFSQIHIYSKMMKKQNVMYLDNYKHYYNKLQKKLLFQNSFVWKRFFWQKNDAPSNS